ncbi:MAG: mobilization protein [Muricauda sp.]|nr:type IV secretion system DNA-binding domain-containing protein [Allomuricauda sp.]MBC31433.1 mobilization protein [Allomuricauda sp.]|tara:strand:+ start:3396 stop:4853 length:1458 start_codon:yes stop_codon:yes gene_type:complete
MEAMLVLWSLAIWAKLLLYVACPLLLVTVVLYVFKTKDHAKEGKDAFTVTLTLRKGKLVLENIRRGVSIIGAAGSGKTESVVAQFLHHFAQNGFSGVVHDYKNFELTEILYPMIDHDSTDFHCISFDPIHARVNPIAPRYLGQPEDVNEVVRVMLANLLEQKEEPHQGSGKFFTDAVEGLLGGMIWRLRMDYPQYCTLPHLIALYQQLDIKSLSRFLKAGTMAKAMANAFLQGLGSERQTAGVLSTLSNALKKITTLRTFYVLSADEVPLDVNQQQRPTLVSLVNNPKYESAYAPVIATILHTLTKQMAVRNAKPSFLLVEEAPTIRLINMHRIPATMRSFDIATLYVMQDKIQNDMMYGEKASKAILSNLSYQFFGKVNDPDTAKYYERFFEIIKKPTKSVNRSDTMNFDTRVTTGEREVSKIRADIFFKLLPGEFISFADGREKKVWFKQPSLQKGLPQRISDVDLEANFIKIHQEVRTIFGV